jgi:hypothetical protein
MDINLIKSFYIQVKIMNSRIYIALKITQPQDYKRNIMISLQIKLNNFYNHIECLVEKMSKNNSVMIINDSDFITLCQQKGKYCKKCNISNSFC